MTLVPATSRAEVRKSWMKAATDTKTRLAHCPLRLTRLTSPPPLLKDQRDTTGIEGLGNAISMNTQF